MSETIIVDNDNQVRKANKRLAVAGLSIVTVQEPTRQIRQGDPCTKADIDYLNILCKPAAITKHCNAWRGGSIGKGGKVKYRRN